MQLDLQSADYQGFSNKVIPCPDRSQVHRELGGRHNGVVKRVAREISLHIGTVVVDGAKVPGLRLQNKVDGGRIRVQDPTVMEKNRTERVSVVARSVEIDMETHAGSAEVVSSNLTLVDLLKNFPFKAFCIPKMRAEKWIRTRSREPSEDQSSAHRMGRGKALTEQVDNAFLLLDTPHARLIFRHLPWCRFG